MDPDSSGMSTPHTGINNGGYMTDDGRSLGKPHQNTQNTDTFTGYSMVPPNESKRSKMLRISQKELEDLARWKTEHQPGPIHLQPETLGGSVSLAEVRQRQQVEASSSKLQKKLKKNEMDKRKRQDEKEKNEKIKAAQREKANILEMKKKKEEEQRRELYQCDLQMRREEYLQRLERSSSVPMATSTSTPTSSWARGREHREARRAEVQTALQQKKEDLRIKGEKLEEKQKLQEETSAHLRVNLAFLDRLEARGSGRASQPPLSPLEGSNMWEADGPQDPVLSLGAFPPQLQSDGARMEEEEDADHDWAVMRLQTQFPYYERDQLEDIVSQCNGNYHQAYDLLNV
ncbi:epithelial-stromal interaction protein 1 [Brachyhypopomus gauderio]|uniref:epithelial-stromal interaction protein 1 n=1 Tax=Brachyhypopomus gauderio TaxID=698409 RepID=UPI00404174AE